jgi:DNA-binding transcriptional ArsR family regulator
MLMSTVQWLRESGLAVQQSEPGLAGDARADAVLEVAAGDQSARFAVEVKQRAPYPNELEGLGRVRETLSRLGQPLLVAPFVSQTLGVALTGQGWSWADAQGDFDLRAPGLLLRQRRAVTPPKPVQTTLPRGSGSFAVIRALIRFGEGQQEEAGTTTLAAQAGVSQPRASQVLSRLRDHGLVERVEHGRWRPNRQALLDRFMAEYRGPGGSEWYFYTLDAPADVAVGAARSLGHQVALSADVGPDLIVPWRRPSTVILYVKRVPDMNGLGLELVDAQGRHDANVIVRMPADRSVFPVPALVAELHGVEIGLADPSQMLWDLDDLGGADRAEAAGRLREWLLASR